MNNGIIRVDQWNPSPDDIVFDVTGQMIRVDFNKIIKTEIPEDFKMCIIKKISYCNWMANAFSKRKVNDEEVEVEIKGGCHYINYFIKFYDPEGELLHSYLKLKYIIEETGGRSIKPKAMKKLIYKILFTSSIQSKIKQMTEDNWYLDVTPDPKKKYPEELKFNNTHAKILMNLSISIKMMIPIVMHYLNVTGLFDDDSNNITPFFLGTFDMFSGEVDIYNKLWITVSYKVNRSLSEDETLWHKHEMFDKEERSYIHELVHTNIIRDAIFRYVFNSSPLSFNSVLVEYQLNFMMQTRFTATLINADASGNNSVEGLSGIDKIELNSYKVDEGNLVLNRLNTRHSVAKLKKAMKYRDFDEAVEYYRDHHRISPIHIQIINIYASKVGCRDLSILDRTEYIQMMTIIKRMLQMRGFVYLPQILSANVNMSTRIIRNKKFLSSIESSSVYKNIIEDKYSALLELGKEDIITNMMSTVVSSTYTIVDFEDKDRTGSELEFSSADLLSEFLQYLSLA